MDDHKPTSWKRPLLLTLGARVAYSLFAACAALLQPVNWRLMHSNALSPSLAQHDSGFARLTRGPATRLWSGVLCAFLSAMNLALLWLLKVGRWCCERRKRDEGYKKPLACFAVRIIPAGIKSFLHFLPAITV